MKLPNLTIIFVIIILPISILLSSYVSASLDTLKLQRLYDQSLKEATYEAIQAFQANTTNSSTSNLSDSKIRDIQAAVNSFFMSLQTKLSMRGYDKEALQNHVPAVVMTLYDGYYIYAPYENIENGNEIEYDLKPYVYYSCRYIKGSLDVVITYSLDSYVKITGKEGTKTIDLQGYLLSSAQETASGKITYKNIQIDEETNLTENILIDGQPQEVPYRKVNGTKYYKYNGEYYRISNGKLEKTRVIPVSSIETNTNAQEYYKEAINLKNAIKSSELRNLTIGNAVDENGTPIFKDSTNYPDYYHEYADTIKIFDELNNGLDKTQIEDKESNFNAHKAEIIKYAIEKNLSVAISNFDHISTTSTSFEMPKLKDEEWEMLSKNIGMISFLQGLPIGGKIYNGYSIVNNNKNEEFVSEESIYMETKNNEYHRIQDKALTTNIDNIVGGFFNVDYLIKTMGYEQTIGGEQIITTGRYYPRKALACYHCLVEQDRIEDTSVQNILDTYPDLAKIYYTALARERYGIYRVENAF